MDATKTKMNRLPEMSVFGTRSRTRFVVPLLLILGLTLSLRPVNAQIGPTTVALVFLLVVLFTATFFGRNPALLASFAAMLSYNYFFLPPFLTWHVADTSNLVAWATFTLTAMIAGELSAYARRRADEAERGKVEIERLYGELRTAFEKASHAEALRQSEQLKSSLLDAVTHDLRTPLTSIKASITTLLDDRRSRILDNEGRKEFLEIIDEETDRLNEFIEGIVGIAKIEANAMHLRKTPSSAEEILGHAANRARGRLEEYDFRIELEADLPPVNVDAHSMTEVAYTLLDNAMNYSPKGSKIRAAARMSNGAVEFSVEDQGRGVAPELREKIFGKFFRIETHDVHTTGSGLGLGLAIARGIVESQGGTIRVEDGANEFTTRFVFEVPVDARI